MINIKKVVKKALHAFGVDVVRHKPKTDNIALPPIFDDPLEALCILQGGEKVAAFECPLDRTIHRKGFCWDASKGWHPFVETLREYEFGKSKSYEDSILKVYYDRHQPQNAADALIGFGNPPDALCEYPSYGYRLSPWRSDTIEGIGEIVRYWTRKDNEEHGMHGLAYEVGGNKAHGPVSKEKGRLEYERLTSVYDSIKENGYKYSEGLPHVRVLKRGDEYLFRPVRRKHRIAAMAVLGYDSVPAMYDRISVVDITMVDWWPQVVRGIWSREQATDYFNHLFEFDSRRWARNRGLLFDQENNE